LAEGKFIDEETIAAEKTRIILESKKYKAPLGRIFDMSKGSIWALFVAFLGAIGLGAASPLIGWFVTEAVFELIVVPTTDDPNNLPCVAPMSFAVIYKATNSSSPIPDLDFAIREGAWTGQYAPCQPPSVVVTDALRASIADYAAGQGLVIMGYLFAIGFGIWLGGVIVFGFMAIPGETAGLRIRSAAFKSLLRAEVSFHDNPDNSPGALANHLEVSAMCIPHLTGPGTVYLLEFIIALILCSVLTLLECWQLSLLLTATTPLVMLSYGLKKNLNEIFR
jgi:ABC-type multidrug transport system fused ATPase/permease subunit